MEIQQSSNRIHPLMAGAAISVMLVSLVGAAAITGILPTSHGSSAPTLQTASTLPAQALPANIAASAALPDAAQAAVPAAPVVQHKHEVVHRHVVSQPRQTRPAQTAPAPQYVQTAAPAVYQPQPQYQPPVQQSAAPTTGIGIATGAVIGGLLGNQIGGGNGRALATIAGAVGGGYVGNEVEKRTRY